MATLVPPPSKKARREEREKVAQASTSASGSNGPLAPNLVVSFSNAKDDSSLGPAVRLPADTDKAGLELLANQLAKAQKKLQKHLDGEDDEDDDDDEPVPFSFHVLLPGSEQRIPVLKDLWEVLKQNSQSLSTEDTIRVVCEPEAVFKVRLVTRCSSTLSGHGQPILCASFSPTGNLLATGSGDNTARLWDLSTELPKATLTGHTGWILCVEWDGYESTVATGSMDNSVRIWEPKTGKPIGEPLKGHTKWITSLAWEPIHLTSSSKGPRLASASKDNSVRIWNPRMRRIEYALGGHTASVNSVKWGGDGIIYTASSDRTVKLWNSDSGKLIRSLDAHAHWVNTLALNTDFVLRTGPYDHTGKAPKDDADARKRAGERYNAFVAANPEMLISGSDDHTLFLWPSQRSETPKKPLARLTGHQKQVNHVAFSPDGKWIASAGFDNAVKLWDGRTGRFITSLRGHVGAVYRLSFSSDSRQLVSASKDSTLKLWSLAKGKLIMDLPGHTDEVYCCDFVGDKIASGGRDKKVKIWKH